MTNEEKILERLDYLTREMEEAKIAARPMIDLKKDLEPIIGDVVNETIAKLGGMDRSFSIEDLGDMVGQLLVSSKHLTEGLKSLNRLVELKDDIAPLTKDMFGEAVSKLDAATKGFNSEDLAEVIKMTTLNLGNMAEGLKMMNSAMEFKSDVGDLSKLAFDDVVSRLEDLKKRGFFNGMQQMFDIGERVSNKVASIDFDAIPPIKGPFAMLGAMKRPEIQAGLGVMLEMATILSVVKKPDA